MDSGMRDVRFAVIGALLCAMATQAHAATITVANGNDSGTGSLRQAISDASPGDTINFAPTVTSISLLTGELLIDKNLTITGPGANRLTVQVSANASRIFPHQLEYGNCFYLRDHDLKWHCAGWPWRRRHSELWRIDTYRLYHLR